MEKGIIPIKVGEVLEVKPNWLQEKEVEVQRGEEALVQLQKIEGISKAKVARVKGRIRFVRKFIELMKEGFIPIPRMEFEPIDTEYRPWLHQGPKFYLDPMPVEAIAAIAEYQGKFDHFGLVKPQAKKRDPFLIGIISYGHLEEHFLLGWWRPDLLKPCELW